MFRAEPTGGETCRTRRDCPIRSNSMFWNGISPAAWTVNFQRYSGRCGDKVVEPALEAIEVEINDWRGVEREHLAQRQSADHRISERLPQLRSGAAAER